MRNTHHDMFFGKLTLRGRVRRDTIEFIMNLQSINKLGISNLIRKR